MNIDINSLPLSLGDCVEMSCEGVKRPKQFRSIFESKAIATLLWVRDLISDDSYDNTQTNMEKVRARVIIEGRVQGVFFRHHTQETAFRLGVKGWVRNRRDGRVEAIFEGDKDQVDQIIQWCHRGPSEAKVTKVYTTWEDYAGEFDDFSVNY